MPTKVTREMEMNYPLMMIGIFCYCWYFVCQVTHTILWGPVLFNPLYICQHSVLISLWLLCDWFLHCCCCAVVLRKKVRTQKAVGWGVLGVLIICEATRAIYKRKSSEVIQRCIHTL
jgi:hypothetical protein